MPTIDQDSATNATAQALRLARRQRHELRRQLPASIGRRNATVLEHLGLAHHASALQWRRGGGERDELLQEATLGLIAAVDGFDGSRGLKISSYAMSRAHGQVLHFRRDRQATLRIPWRLRDLHAKGQRIQEDSLNTNGCLLDDQTLARRLNVTPDRWRQAVEAAWQQPVLSLDGPAQNCDHDEAERVSRLDRLAAIELEQPDPALDWLGEALKTIPPVQRRWLLAYYLEGRPLRTLAASEGVHPSMLSRVLKKTLEQLKTMAQGTSDSMEAALIANKAATAV